MATVVTTHKPTKTVIGEVTTQTGGYHQNGRGDFSGAGGSSLRHGRLGMALGLAAIGMMFMAFTSAYIVRQGLDTGWHSIELPPLLWLNTAIILGSSVALETARRLLRRGAESPFKLWFSAATVLGLGFLAGQIAVWGQLRANGIYVATTPHSSFFYVMTVSHAVHLVGGLLALGYILLRGQAHGVAGRGSMRNRQLAVDVTALYWHFLAVLWVYLFIVLFVWR